MSELFVNRLHQGVAKHSDPRAAGYRARLLHRCLVPKHQIARSKRDGAIIPTLTQASPEHVVTVGSDVGDLLDFLHTEASPYEITIPPYLRDDAKPQAGKRPQRAPQRKDVLVRRNADGTRWVGPAEERLPQSSKDEVQPSDALTKTAASGGRVNDATSDRRRSTATASKDRRGSKRVHPTAVMTESLSSSQNVSEPRPSGPAASPSKGTTVAQGPPDDSSIPAAPAPLPDSSFALTTTTGDAVTPSPLPTMTLPLPGAGRPVGFARGQPAVTGRQAYTSEPAAAAPSDRSVSPRTRALEQHLTLRRAAARSQWAILAGRNGPGAPAGGSGEGVGSNTSGRPESMEVPGSAPSAVIVPAQQPGSRPDGFVALPGPGSGPDLGAQGVEIATPPAAAAVHPAAVSAPAAAAASGSAFGDLTRDARTAQGAQSSLPPAPTSSASSRSTAREATGTGSWTGRFAASAPAAAQLGPSGPATPSAGAGPGTRADAASALAAAARVPKALLPLTLQGRIALIEAALEQRRAAMATAAASSGGREPAATATGRGSKDPVRGIARSVSVDLKGKAADEGFLKNSTAKGATTAGGMGWAPDAGSAAGESGLGARVLGGVDPPQAEAAGVPPLAQPQAGARGGRAMTAASQSLSSSRSGSPSPPPAAHLSAPPVPEAAKAAARSVSTEADSQVAPATLPPPADATTRAVPDSGPPAAGPAAPPPSAAGPAAPPPSAAGPAAPPQAAAATEAARELFEKFAKYMPEGREDGPALLAPLLGVRFQRSAFQAAAEAAAEAPGSVLTAFDVRHLSSILAAYAAVGIAHEPFLRVLAAAAYEAVMSSPTLNPASASASAWASRSSGAQRRPGGGRNPRDAHGNASGAGNAGDGRADAASVAAGTAAAAAPRHKPLTFRAACVMLTALARLGYAEPRLVSALGLWIARSLRSGAVTPRAKWRGTWFSAALWAYATLERLSGNLGRGAGAAAFAAGGGSVVGGAGPDGGAADASSAGAGAGARAGAGPRAAGLPVKGAAPTGTGVATAAASRDVSVAGAALFTEAAEAVTVAPGWLTLLECREAMWALWAFRVAASVYAAPHDDCDDGGAMAAAAQAATVPYTPDALVELQLAERAASQIDMLDPGQLAEAYGVVAEAGFGADRDFLTALRRSTLARAHAARPQPLTVMVAALAVMQIRDVVWLSALAAACRKKMVNMQPEEIVVVLHAFGAALRFYYMPLFKGAAVMCSVPGLDRLQGMAAGDVVRLLAAFAAVGHYEGLLIRKAAARILGLGAVATLWQRASVLQSASRLGYRSNALLRAVAAEVFGITPGSPAHTPAGANALLTTPTPASTAVATAANGDLGPGAVAAAAGATRPAAAPQVAAAVRAPPALLVTVASACGQLQYRPPGLLPALHAAREREWTRLGLPQRAAMCWALLVLTGGLDSYFDSVTAREGGAGNAAAGGSSDVNGERNRRPAEQGGPSQAGGAAEQEKATGTAKRRRKAATKGATTAEAAAAPQQPDDNPSMAGPAAAPVSAAAAAMQPLLALGPPPPPLRPQEDDRSRMHPEEQLRLLGSALMEYVEALAGTMRRQGSDALHLNQDHHQAQLLLACHVLTWSEPPGTQQQPALPAAARAGGADHPQPAGRAGARTGGLPAEQRHALAAELQRLPASVLRRVLAAQRRAREAALGPWAAEVAGLLRVALADVSRPWRGRPQAGAPAGGGLSGRGSGWLPAGLSLVGGRVAEGVLLCDGALGVDVCVELELELGLEVESAAGAVWGAGAPSGADSSSSGQGRGDQGLQPPEGKRRRRQAVRQLSAAAAVEEELGAGSGATPIGGQAQGQCVTLRLAVELCAVEPAAAAAGGGATGGDSGCARPGNSVVRNSAWCLSGSGALRTRLLRGLGWRVVVLRERDWWDFRSPEQQQRGLEALLGRALRRDGSLVRTAE